MKGSVQYRTLAGILTVAALLLTGCPQPGEQQAAQAPATSTLPAPTQAPTLPPTDTPAPPTATPSPTQEPSPTPGPTATLTPIPAPITTATSQTDIPPEAYMTLLAMGNSLYQSGEYVRAAALYTEMLDREPDPEVYSLRAETYSRMGDFAAAITDYLAAVALGTDDDPVDDLILNNLCWDLGITGQAEKALPYCAQAVEAEPSASYRDSRGVSYAQVGMLDEALADFQAVVDELKDATDASLKAIVTQRQEWIDALKGGANPFTPEVLAQLRDEEHRHCRHIDACARCRHGVSLRRSGVR